MYVNINTQQMAEKLPPAPIVSAGKVVSNPKFKELIPFGWRIAGEIPKTPDGEVVQAITWENDANDPVTAKAVLITKLESVIAAEQAAYDQAVAEQDAAAKAKHDDWLARVNAAFDPKQAEIIIELSQRWGI
jgi:hypothetical protein